MTLITRQDTTAWPRAARCLIIAVFLLLPAQFVSAQSYDAFLEPVQVVEISAPFRDRITAIHVGIGDKVEAGQLLAELDSSVLKARLESAETAASFKGRIDSAKAFVTMQENRYEMLQDLQKSGNARPQEMTKAQTDLFMARAQLQSALEEQTLKKLEAAIIRAQIEEKKLRSPVDGIVVTIDRQLAELIGGTDQERFMTIVQLDPLQALFHLPPEIAITLDHGTTLPLEIDGVAASGTIAFISPIINAQSGTVEVRVTIANPDNNLMSGSRCTFTKR